MGKALNLAGRLVLGTAIAFAGCAKKPSNQGFSSPHESSVYSYVQEISRTPDSQIENTELFKSQGEHVLIKENPDSRVFFSFGELDGLQFICISDGSEGIKYIKEERGWIKYTSNLNGNEVLDTREERANPEVVQRWLELSETLKPRYSD